MVAAGHTLVGGAHVDWTDSYWLEHTYPCRQINHAHRYKVSAVGKGEQQGPTIHRWRGRVVIACWKQQPSRSADMAGGKGRGIAAFSFNIESLGLSRGNMPQTRVGPNKLYPDVEFKPVPLKAGEDEDYMLALKQEIRGTMRGLPHNIRPLAGKGDVERYKERYQRQKMLDEEWTPDWQLFPKELMPQKKKLNAKPVGAKKKPIKVSSKEKADVISKLDELEKKDDVKSDEEKEEKKTEEGDEEEIEGEELDEEELEEENDYIASYFEDGDDFGAGSDENMDEGATY